MYLPSRCMIVRALGWIEQYVVISGAAGSKDRNKTQKSLLRKSLESLLSIFTSVRCL